MTIAKRSRQTAQTIQSPRPTAGGFFAPRVQGRCDYPYSLRALGIQPFLRKLGIAQFLISVDLHPPQKLVETGP
jgi:hypothetical protein